MEPQSQRRATKRQTITKRVVDAMCPGDSLSDDRIIGFTVRCLRSGARTYAYRYRDRRTGAQRTDYLGIHGSITPDQARDLAQKRAGAVADRRDPVAERKAERRAAKLAPDHTFRSVSEKFIERYAKKETRRWQETDRILARYVSPSWGDKRIDEISRLDVVELLDLIQDGKLKDADAPGQTLGGPVMADRVLAAIRKLFNWHAIRDEAFRSPIVKGMARTKPRLRARDRILSDDELRALWVAAPAEPVYGPAVKFMLLSAQRPGEVLALRRSDIDTDGVWTLAAETYKTQRAHYVPLPRSALAIVDTTAQHPDGDFVFTTMGDRPFSGDTKAKGRLDKAMLDAMRAAAAATGMSAGQVAKLKLPRWTAHDLRRTARSLMSRAGVRSDIAERVLGHVIAGVAGVYDRHDYAAEKRAALDALAGLVERIVAGKSAEIVQMGEAANVGPRRSIRR